MEKLVTNVIVGVAGFVCATLLYDIQKKIDTIQTDMNTVKAWINAKKGKEGDSNLIAKTHPLFGEAKKEDIYTLK